MGGALAQRKGCCMLAAVHLLWRGGTLHVSMREEWLVGGVQRHDKGAAGCPVGAGASKQVMQNAARKYTRQLQWQQKASKAQVRNGGCLAAAAAALASGQGTYVLCMHNMHVWTTLEHKHAAGWQPKPHMFC